MAPTPDPQALWSHKARALLLPTPLEVIDPEGESQRQVELLALLEESGFSLPDWNIEDPLHQNAYKDAYFAHAPLSSQPTSTLPPLRHPLSGETIGSTPSRNELLTRHWPTLLTRLREILHAPGDHKARYRALWCALMDPKEFPWLAELPHHPTYCDHAVMAHRSAAAAFVGARLGGDEAALLQFHVGPVQSFIAAARRTGDLWLGSYIVAYLSMQAVHAIADELGPDAILYPDLSTLPLYRAVANFGERDLDGWLRAALPNRFAAIVPRSRGEDLAQTAAKAVAECWRDMGHAVRSKIQQLIEKNVELANSKHWSEFSTQLSGHLEMDARIRTWPAEPPSGRPPDEKYVYTFRQVRDELTAQRRMLTRLQRRGTSAPKCTQCGDREQLGAGSEHDVQQFWRDLRKDIDQSFQNLRKDIDQSFQNPNNSGTDGGDRETLDLRDGEGLCAVCLTKRFANRWYFGNAALPDKERPPLQLDWCKANDDRPRLRFPSVATIASAPFRKALHVTNRLDANGWKEALDNAHKLLKFTPPGNLLPGLGDIGRTQDIVLDTEGTWFYETSYDPQTALRDHDAALDAAEQAQLVEDLQLPLAEGLKCLQAARKDIYKAFVAQKQDPSAPPLKPDGTVHVTPYYAIVSLDVDRMGNWLDGSHKHSLTHADFGVTDREPTEKRPLHPALHREISRRQGHLATKIVYEVVEKQHLGRVIYSGGDDLLAFLPLQTVWRCLDDLREEFRKVEALGNKITISAGVAITHWRSPLGTALERARRAEERAKRTRNRIAVVVDKRSGDILELVESWGILGWIEKALPRVAALDETPTHEAEATNLHEGSAKSRRRLPRVYLNNLHCLGRESEQLAWCPPQAFKMRLYALVTGQQLAQGSDPSESDPFFEFLWRERRPDPVPPCDPEDTPTDEDRTKFWMSSCLAALHLLRFLAREYDPALVALCNPDVPSNTEGGS